MSWPLPVRESLAATIGHFYVFPPLVSSSGKDVGASPTLSMIKSPLLSTNGVFPRPPQWYPCRCRRKKSFAAAPERSFPLFRGAIVDEFSIALFRSLPNKPNLHIGSERVPFPLCRRCQCLSGTLYDRITKDICIMLSLPVPPVLVSRPCRRRCVSGAGIAVITVCTERTLSTALPMMCRAGAQPAFSM